MKLTWVNKVTIFIVAIIIVLMIAGALLNPGTATYSIGSCSATWSWTERIVESPYCPDGLSRCRSDPAIEQHNALTDVILCACDNARTNNYASVGENTNIENLYLEVTSFTSTVETICEQPNLVKWTYPSS